MIRGSEVLKFWEIATRENIRRDSRDSLFGDTYKTVQMDLVGGREGGTGVEEFSV
jgi:hypothetical protein